MKRQSRSADAVDEVEVIEVFGGCFPPFAQGRRSFTKLLRNQRDKRKITCE